MTQKTRRLAASTSRSLSACALLAALLSMTSLHAQQLLAPGAPVAGQSQSELSAMWWNWALQYPAESNPILDTTGAYASMGDQGTFFFLAGSFGSDAVTRSVTVRTNQILFFPLITVVSDIPNFGQDESEIRADAADNVGTLGVATITLDGAAAVLAAGTSTYDDYRQQSPLFPLVFVPDNIFGEEPSVHDAVSDGWWVALAPLSTGAHQLHFTALSEGQGAYAGLTVSQDITYQITAVPEASTAAMLGSGLAVLLALRRRRHG